MSHVLQNSQNLTVSEYATAVASASPTPGGGSVAATVGALAASLAEMVCNLTLAGKKASAEPEALNQASIRAAAHRKQLLDLATADEGAYGSYRAAAALPKSTEVEIEIRQSALQAALSVSTEVPILIAETALAATDQLMVAAQFGTKHALSDVATGAYLSEAAIRSSLLNVEANARSLTDRTKAESYLARSAQLTEAARASAAQIVATVKSRS